MEGAEGLSDDKMRMEEFLAWLQENGASFPKISWPSNETESGSRGAVAVEPIATYECMVNIPVHLMMSPLQAYSDPEIGESLQSCKDLLYGDLLLAVYIMHELRKGRESFYHPYLRIIPESCNIAEWSNDELHMLQDSAISVRAKNRKQMIKAMYSKTIEALNARHPEIFPLADFTFERFKFSWNTIQARAFGRRLPWTALVPFADCLNHNNVQTKYDYDIEGNGMFRLFPSGSNSYAQGVEVFNSYGRRANENLLLDYGFAMEDNEWEDVDICLTLPDSDPHYSLRRRALFFIGMNTSRLVRLNRFEIPLQALTFLRVVLVEASHLEYILSSLETTSVATSHSALTSGRAVEEGLPPSTGVMKSIEKHSNATPLGCTTVTRALAQKSSIRSEALSWFERILSPALELRALKVLRGVTLAVLAQHPTHIRQDEAALRVLQRSRTGSSTQLQDQPPQPPPSCARESSLALALTEHIDLGVASTDDPATARLAAVEEARLAEMAFDSEAYWKTLSALNYRLTRKRVLVRSLALMDQLIAYFECVAGELDTPHQGSDTREMLDAGDLTELWFSHVCLDPIQNDERAYSKNYTAKLQEYLRDATQPAQWSSFHPTATNNDPVVV